MAAFAAQRAAVAAKNLAALERAKILFPGLLDEHFNQQSAALAQEVPVKPL